MAASAGKKESVSLSLVMEVNPLWQRSFIFRLRRCVDEKMERRAADGVKEKQIFEVQTWRQVRRLAGAVMCETRDLGIKWAQWHTLLFEEQVARDMRVVCLQDAKKMFLKQARMVCWKKSAAKHDPSFAAKKDQRIVDRQAPTCDEEVGRGRRRSAAKLTPYWLL